MKTKLLISAFAIASFGGIATAQVAETDAADTPVVMESETTTTDTTTVIETETTEAKPVTNADYAEEGEETTMEGELTITSDEDSVELEFEAEDAPEE